jgi:hypothetical protein
MPRYVIERQYLVPLYEHIFIEAANLKEACRQALDEHAQPWGDETELDFDNARPVTVEQAVELPETVFPELRTSEDADRYALSQALYSSGLDLLPIPREFAEGSEEEEPTFGFV